MCFLLALMPYMKAFEKIEKMTVVWRGCVFLLALPLFSYVNKEPQIRRLLKTHIPGTSETPFRFKKTVMR